MRSTSSHRTLSPPYEPDPSLPGLPLSEELSTAAAELFRALADPNRTRIVHALAHQDMSTSGLAALLEMSLPAVSQQLRLLRLLRIVKSRREGHSVYYSLDDRHIRLLISLTLMHLQEERGGRSARAEREERRGVSSVLADGD